MGIHSIPRLAGFFACVAVAAIGGCESVAALQNTARLPSLQRNVVQADGFRVVASWCSISADREAECEFEVTSLYQDKKAGLVYPVMQDNDGNDYRMLRKDGKVAGQLMIVGEPYKIRLVAKNLPTYAKQVRSVSGSFVGWNLRGIKASERPVVFAKIPEKPVEAPAEVVAVVRQTPTPSVAAAPVASEAPVAVTSPLEAASAVVANSYWYGIIVPVIESDAPDADIVKLWRRGAYMHFRKDGVAGYNWSKPSGYIYDRINRWSQNGSFFTLTMGAVSYTFDTEEDGEPLVAYLDQGGMFKMTMDQKTSGAK